MLLLGHPDLLSKGPILTFELDRFWGVRSIVSLPALKIGRIGVQKEYQRNGIGIALLKYTIGVVVRLNEELNVGCRFITLDAYPQSIPWYEKNGFVFNLEYKDPAKTHPSMRYDIIKGPRF